jgi:hypothetical protein
MTNRDPRGPGAPGGSSSARTITFSEDRGVHSGTGRGDRHWRITACYTGWSLEFREPGDTTTTYAGRFTTLQAAMTEASR